MTVGSCPECDGMIDLGSRPQPGQKIVCPDCNARLEIINADPIELDWCYHEPKRDWRELETLEIERNSVMDDLWDER